MLTVRGETLALAMGEDGRNVVVEDLARGLCWRLDEASRLVSCGIPRDDLAAYAADTAGEAPRAVALGAGAAARVGDAEIRAVYATAAGTLTLRWVMERDRLRIIAEADDESGVTGLCLPGAFRPGDGEPFLAAVPTAQGILHTGRGPAFYRTYLRTGHNFGFTLAMFGLIADCGALLAIAETDVDLLLHHEKTAEGAVRLMWRQVPSLGRLAYLREVVLMAAPPDLTALCKTYRRYEIARGRFKSWEEKLAERPALTGLFGAAIVYLGYLQDPDLDYAAALRGLKAAGIDRAYVYPLYCNTTLDIRVGLGLQWIDERRQLPLLRELGYLAGSFIYLTDGPPGAGDLPENLLLTESGAPYLLWQMGDLQWFTLSHEAQCAWARHFLEGEQGGLDGIHYDVLMCHGFEEDYHPAHRRDRRADRRHREALLDYAADKGLIVSSEGFNGRFAAHYDLGNSKYQQALGGEEYCVVPMTMLVYHDAAWHTWWEVDNYNNPEHRSQGGRGYRDRFPLGGGHIRLQAAMDAIMGTPPDLFPFGMQYNFIPHTQQLYTYRCRLEDAAVQQAIAAARPVMALNARVGRLELLEHRLHHPDGAVQESVFADGTRVLANFANVALEAPGAGLLPPESWRVAV